MNCLKSRKKYDQQMEREARQLELEAEKKMLESLSELEREQYLTDKDRQLKKAQEHLMALAEINAMISHPYK